MGTSQTHIVVHQRDRPAFLPPPTGCTSAAPSGDRDRHPPASPCHRRGRPAAAPQAAVVPRRTLPREGLHPVHDAAGSTAPYPPPAASDLITESPGQGESVDVRAGLVVPSADPHEVVHGVAPGPPAAGVGAARVYLEGVAPRPAPPMTAVVVRTTAGSPAATVDAARPGPLASTARPPGGTAIGLGAVDARSRVQRVAPRALPSRVPTGSGPDAPGSSVSDRTSRKRSNDEGLHSPLPLSSSQMSASGPRRPSARRTGGGNPASRPPGGAVGEERALPSPPLPRSEPDRLWTRRHGGVGAAPPSAGAHARARPSLVAVPGPLVGMRRRPPQLPVPPIRSGRPKRERRRGVPSCCVLMLLRRVAVVAAAGGTGHGMHAFRLYFRIPSDYLARPRAAPVPASGARSCPPPARLLLPRCYCNRLTFKLRERSGLSLSPNPNVCVAPSCSLPSPRGYSFRLARWPQSSIRLASLYFTPPSPAGRTLPARRRRRCRPTITPWAANPDHVRRGREGGTRSTPTSAVSLFRDLIRAAIRGKTAVHAGWSTLSPSSVVADAEAVGVPACFGLKLFRRLLLAGGSSFPPRRLGTPSAPRRTVLLSQLCARTTS